MRLNGPICRGLNDICHSLRHLHLLTPFCMFDPRGVSPLGVDLKIRVKNSFSTQNYVDFLAFPLVGYGNGTLNVIEMRRS